jgi:hypothetical protein
MVQFWYRRDAAFHAAKVSSGRAAIVAVSFLKLHKASAVPKKLFRRLRSLFRTVGLYDVVPRPPHARYFALMLCM